ncbi:MAG: hypothetical protein NVSMB9_10650 [Isosphaeraceae bacterium]
MAQTRRTFTREFKAEAVTLVPEQGKSLAKVPVAAGRPRDHLQHKPAGELLG